MTDTQAGAPAAGAEGEIPQTGIRILAQYIRDLSFENPRAPDSLRGPAQPAIDLGVELNARGREDHLEVKLLRRADDVEDARPAERLRAVPNGREVGRAVAVAAVLLAHDNDTIFHVELIYAGLFQIGGVADEDLEKVLMIECPRYLFPFARRLIADLTAEGGFPPFLLEPIDFAGVYAARKAQAEAAPAGNA